MESSLKIFFEISNQWELTSEQEKIIIGISHEDKLEHAELLDESIQEKIRYLSYIYKALHSLFPKNPELANRWVHTSNHNVIFGNNPPIELIKKDLAGIRIVYEYLAGHLSSPFC